ncbi:ABC transporter substrate-binding protein [Pleomorphomonas sp. JP5]|uniref:ABC transporter substrate-binding protein n=1 Tax=Pleomorphomonas sp. JP5 TaxID=2942998 RepID=UPI00204480A2|nr:extracellular solute-binding protein [Pleomorphomonas sp. JP5]MCM5558101.1 extracellular solute-binding protein [Pleomorphomonas sp. JP5]
MKKYATLAVLAATVLASFPAFAETVKVLSIEPNVKEGRDFYAAAIDKFEKANPDIKIQFDYLDDTSFKSKLPTLLQSAARPDIFFTWTGGVFHEQADAGVLRDISGDVDPKALETFAPGGIKALTYKDKLYGLPMYAGVVVLFYNKELTDKAGIDPKTIKTWDDFLAAVKTVKEAGITPIVVGGKSKWPLQHYYGYLATRIAGTDGIVAASAGENGGLAGPDFIKAGEEFKRLADLQPFQPGFMDTDNSKAGGLFGDGRGAFILSGNYMIGAQKRNSTSGSGISDENLGFIPFPVVEGGKGDPADTFGGINGWLVSKNATPAAAKFLESLMDLDNQTTSASMDLWLPIVKGADAGIKNANIKAIANLLASAPHHQLYLDQELGANVGAAMNDASAQLATGDISPEEAAEMVEEANEMR